MVLVLLGIVKRDEGVSARAARSAIKGKFRAVGANSVECHLSVAVDTAWRGLCYRRKSGKD